MTKLKSYYFPHDFQARHDQRLILLRKKGGAAAIGVYWMLIELLHEHNNSYQFLTIVNKELTASDFGIEVEQLEQLIGLMVEIGLVELDENKILSNKRVSDNLLKRKDISEKRRQARSSVNKCEELLTIHDKEKKRKEDNTKEDLKEKRVKKEKTAPGPISLQASLLPIPEKIKPSKLNFGEEGKVLLTAEEHQKLEGQLGAEKLESCISLLNDFIGSKKKDPYASHYHAIKKWVIEAVEAKKGNPRAGTGQLKPTAAIVNSMASDFAMKNFLSQGE